MAKVNAVREVLLLKMPADIELLLTFGEAYPNEIFAEVQVISAI